MKFIFSFNVQLTDKDLPQKYVFEERDVIFIKEKKEVTKEKVAIFKNIFSLECHWKFLRCNTRL